MRLFRRSPRRPFRIDKIIIALGIFLFCFLPLVNSETKHAVRLSTWIVYWDLPSLARLSPQILSQFDSLSLFAYHFDEEGHLIPAISDLDQIRTRLPISTEGTRPKMYLTVVNDVVGKGKPRLKDPDVVHQIVSCPRKRQNHIKELVLLAKYYDGIEVDYENLHAKSRDDFSIFIRELAKVLHKKKRLLSVVVEPKTRDFFSSMGKALDYKSLGESADQIKVMLYYYHYVGGTPGPLAPSDWVSKVIAYAQENIPPEKICAVFSLHGIDWKEKKSELISLARVKEIQNKKNYLIKQPEKEASPFFQFRDDDGISHELWFEDDVSLTQKKELLLKVGISEMGLWRWGSADPSVFGLFLE